VAQLNARQSEAVHYIDGPLLVLAGAGSGKTSVITRKIAYLIEKCDFPARNIAAVTFTNKAAREMKERVSQLVKGQKARGLTVSTFHNLGLNIIRKEHKTLGFKAGFSIFDAQDCQALIRDLSMREFDSDSDLVDYFQNTISNWKNDLITPEQALTIAETASETAAACVYEQYTRSLKAYNAVDFDDLILLPVLLFQDYPDILAAWQRKIRYLLVDEYQDTNTSQYLLVRQLVGDKGSLTVVGDDDQSIYAWRGAKPENLSLLKEDYPTLKVVKLEQNYRSTSRILKAANHLIANNPHEFEKRLWSELGHGDPIRVISCANEDAETERVATEIAHMHLVKAIPFKDFAILYRGNHQSRLLELKLQTHQIPYHISGGISFFSRNEIKDIMAYLRLLINPDDDNAFLRIINTPRRKIGSTTLESLANYANEREISLFTAIDEMGLEQHIKAGNLERLRRFQQWMEGVIRNCSENDPLEAINEMIEDIDYESWLHQNTSSATVAEKRMGNVWYLIDSIRRILEDDEDGETGIEQAIAKLVLRDLMERQEEADESDKVQLMTLHASKGLEYPYVFIVGMEEELLPHRTSIEEDNIEEERRLMYVGITRAKRQLNLTMAAKRKQYGEICSTVPSRFIDELPQEELELEGFGEKNPDVNQKKADQTLSSLKGLFD